MASRNPSSDDTILADWDTGEYSREHGGSKSQRDLAYKHKVSIGKISKLVKGREPSMYKVVNDLVSAKQILAEQNEQTVNSVNSIVDERTKHIQLFNSLAAMNAINASQLPCESHQDHERLSNTILRSKEVVLGKAPDTAVQINNSAEFSEITRRIVKP